MECGNGINYSHWGQLFTMEVWELAVMMHGFDPRAYALGEVVVKDGQSLDVTWEERIIISFLMHQDSQRLNPSTKAPDRKSSIAFTDAILILEKHGLTEIATGLKEASINWQSALTASDISEQERRLQAFEALGGEAKKKFKNGKEGWTFIKIGDLIHQENTNGYARTDPKTIREDLIKALKARKEARRAGQIFKGLGE